MSFYKFDKGDILLNRLRTHARSEFFIYDGKTYYNNTDKNSISLYDGLSDSYPFVYKGKDRLYLKSFTKTDFDQAVNGHVFSGSYPQTSSITVDIYDSSQAVTKTNLYYKIESLKNTFNSYKKRSPHYDFNSSTYGNKYDHDASLVSIPSVFYGSTLKNRSIKCRFYISGTLAGELQDISGNGEMIQVGPEGSAGSGSCAGVALYDEGFLFLTGAWDLNSSHSENYYSGADSPKWKYFGATKTGIPSSSFAVEFQGTNDIPVMTMFAHANKGELNNSSNPTFVVSGSTKIKTTGSYEYIENPELPIKNVTATPFNSTGSFEKTTYISTIGIYDEEKNLIATAKLAKPLRKRERDSYTFKLKLDL